MIECHYCGNNVEDDDRDFERLAELIAEGRTAEALSILEQMSPYAPRARTALHLAAVRKAGL